jgi:putative Mg2+ transporter-C (MgtC) family protein
MNFNPVDALASLLGAWSAGLNGYSVLLRIVLSTVLSAVIGCERSSKRHSAGLRTFILVSLTGTVAMLTDLYLMALCGGTFPILSAAAVVGAAMVSGNSILFSSRSQIKGLTTSAALWDCSLIGLTAGAGLYTVMLLSFFALLASISFFPSIERYLKDKSNHFEIHLELNSKNDLQAFVATVRKLGLRIDDIESNPAYLNSGLSVYSVSLTIESPELRKYKKHAEIIEALQTLDYVSYAEEMN